jgi:hypothetical protein
MLQSAIEVRVRLGNARAASIADRRYLIGLRSASEGLFFRRIKS